jgi:hypothetical protein
MSLETYGSDGIRSKFENDATEQVINETWSAQSTDIFCIIINLQTAEYDRL